MIVNKLLNYNSSKYSEDNHDSDIQQIDKDLITLFNCLGGSVRFGAGNHLHKGENISGIWYTYTTNAVANTEDTIIHSLGAVPIGYIVVKKDKAADLYSSGTSWTINNIYLKCSVASATVTIFILL